MLAPQLVSLEISYAVQGTVTVEELRFHQQLHTITNDVLRLAGLGYVCGVGQGGGRAVIYAGVRRAALEQARSDLQDQFQAVGALDRVTVTTYGTGTGSAQVLWPVPADDHDPPRGDP